MTQNLIIIVGIVELLTFLAILYLIIRANIFVNNLQKEINDLHLYLPTIIRDIRYDLRSLNSELSKQFFYKPVTPQQAGMIAGKIFSELVLFRLNSLKFTKKFIFLSMFLNKLNIRKLCSCR